MARKGDSAGMRVEQVMTPNVEACRPGDSLDAAARIMWGRDCGCVPVVEPAGGSARLVGIITDRDVCMAAYTQGRALPEIDVRSAMATQVYSCRPRDSLAGALKVMEKHQLRRLPVVDQDGRLVGLLSLADAAREAAREHARRTKEITDRRIGEVLEAISAPRGPHDLAAIA